MTRLGPWNLLETLGETEQTVLWIAEHRHESVPAALRISKVHTEKTLRSAWLTANRRPALLDHANIVHHFDLGIVPDGELAGAPYVVTELVGDGSCAEVLGRLPWHEARRILVGVLDALSHAHARGLTHLDLRPNKVLLDGGAPRLTGFGLRWARVERDQPQLSGPAEYLAPEQCEGRWRDWGPPTDLYAVGCLAWALVTGAPPYTTGDVLQSHLFAPVGRLPVSAKVPMGLQPFLERMLHKDPAQRYHSAADALWALSTLGPTDSSTVLGEFNRAEAETQPIPDLDDEGETHIRRHKHTSVRSGDLPPCPRDGTAFALDAMRPCRARGCRCGP